MATISAVAPGARLRRRKNSWRGLSTACCSAATAAGIGMLPDRPWRRARRASASGCMLSARKPRNARRSCGVERAVAGEDGAGDGDARRLAAAGEQRRGQLVDVVLGLRAAERARQQLAALLGDAAQQLLEEGNVHGNAHTPQSCGRPNTAKLTLNYNNFATDAFRWRVRPLASDTVSHRQRSATRGLTPPAYGGRRALSTGQGCLAHSSAIRKGETSMTTETYEILAIKYGEFTSRRRFESFIVGRRPRWPPPHRLFRLGDPQRQPHHRGRLRLRRGRGRQARPQDRAHAGRRAGDDRHLRLRASSS